MFSLSQASKEHTNLKLPVKKRIYPVVDTEDRCPLQNHLNTTVQQLHTDSSLHSHYSSNKINNNEETIHVTSEERTPVKGKR